MSKKEIQETLEKEKPSLVFLDLLSSDLSKGELFSQISEKNNHLSIVVLHSEELGKEGRELVKKYSSGSLSKSSGSLKELFNRINSVAMKPYQRAIRP